MLAMSSWISQKPLAKINYDFLISKLKAYGFCNNALLFMLNYLKNRSQRVIINSSLNTWQETTAGVPQE